MHHEIINRGGSGYLTQSAGGAWRLGPGTAALFRARVSGIQSICAFMIPLIAPFRSEQRSGTPALRVHYDLAIFFRESTALSLRQKIHNHFRRAAQFGA
jgi:hypothetical protein